MCPYMCSLIMYILCVSTAPYRIKGVDVEVNKATQNSQPIAHFLKNIFNTENPVVIDLPEWSQGSRAGTEKPEESEVNNNLFYFFSCEFVLHNSVIAALHFCSY